MSNSLIRLPFILLFLLFPAAMAGASKASAAAPPLLLSFDVERSTDVEALAKIDLQQPATYFVTGEFAAKYPALVRELAQKGTVGSHSYAHPRLTEMEKELVYQDLLNSVRAIESATGRPPVWFRAPFLEINEEIMEIAAELGFRFDSSEADRWVNQGVLKEFPISMNATSRILISDYDIFHSYALDDQMTLELLKENYLDRFGTGRPFVFLLHPSIIAQKTDVLYLFIDFVMRQGGQLMSFDSYLQQTTTSADSNIGIHLDPGSTELDFAQVVKDLQSLSVTDVFLRTHDDSGKSYLGEGYDVQLQQRYIELFDSLQQQKIRVHAWLSALYDPSVAAYETHLAMADGNGTPSKIWLSPSQQSTRDNIQKLIRDLLATLPFDGVHLDHLAYPGLAYDYSTGALKKFAQDTGIDVPQQKAPTIIPEHYYNEWVTWRVEQIVGLAGAASDVIDSADRNILLSASLNTDALINYRDMESLGQDYRILAEYLDLVVSISDVATWMDKSYSIPRITTVSASMIGERPLMIGILDLTEDKAGEAELEILAGELALARNKGEGLILPPYHTLSADRQTSPRKIETLRDLLSSTAEREEPPIYDSELSITYNIPDEYSLPLPQSGNSYLNQDTVLGTTTGGVAPVSDQPEKEVVDTVSPTQQPQDKVSTSSTQPPESESSTQTSPQSPRKTAAGKDQDSSPAWPTPQAFGVNPYFTAAGLILILMLAYYWLKQHRRGRQQELHEEETDIIDWKKMDELITSGAITGSLVHSVARHLRIYDPIDTSRYRVALILHLVDERSQSIDELVKTDLQIPGWHVLVMSHLKEALMYGFLEIEADYLQVTEKGLRELTTLQEQGFNPERWIFAEQRLHEHLLVKCPHCNADNTGHWYWTKFSCTRCGNEILFKQCSTIERSPNAGIELSMHQYA